MALMGSHEEALRSLQSVDLCQGRAGIISVSPGIACPCSYCALRRVDASYFDSVQETLEQVSIDMFSYERSGDPAKWENLFALPFDSNLSTDQRWDRIRDARAGSRGMSKLFFEGLAQRMGYSISIDRGVMPLRAGIAKAGDLVVSSHRLAPPADPADTYDIRNSSNIPFNPYLSQGNFNTSPTAQFPADFWVWTVNILDLGTNSDSASLRDRFSIFSPSDSIIIWQE